MLGPELIRRLSGGRRLALCGAEEGSTAEIKARAGVGPGGEGGGGGGFEGGGGKGGGGGGGGEGGGGEGGGGEGGGEAMITFIKNVKY